MKSTLKIIILSFIFIFANLTFSQTILSKCPKHYMLNFSLDINNISVIASNPDFEGLQLKLDWIAIESQKDNFNFNLVDSILNVAQSFGKKIVFQFQYKTFNGAPPDVPAYLYTDSIYQGGIAYAPDSSSVAKLWIPSVISRLDTVFRAMGAHFGSHPALKGINLPETATYGWNNADYDIRAYINGIKSNIANARKAFPDSVFIIQYLNWLPGSGPTDSLIKNLREIADYTTTFVNTGFGGPDNKIQINPPFTKLMPIQHEYDSLAVLGNATQWSDYGYVNPYTGNTVTAEEILQFSVDSLKDDYIFWLKREPFFTNDVVPTLAAYRNNCADSMITGILRNKQSSIPQNYLLFQNYPNPFNPVTTIQFQLPEDSYVTVKVYDVFGKEAAVLVNRRLSAGFYTTKWNAVDKASGVYIYMLKADKYISSKKLILLK